jgi:hypothetical protein
MFKLKGLAALVLIGLLVASTSVQAAVLSRTNFSKFAFAECPTSGTCTVNFGTVPAKHIYEIKSVSCYVAIGNAAGKVLYWYLTGYSSTKQYGRIHLQPVLLGTSTDSVTYNATSNALIVAPAAASIATTVSRDGSTPGAIPSVDCTISGVDVKLQ